MPFWLIQEIVLPARGKSLRPLLTGQSEASPEHGLHREQRAGQGRGRSRSAGPGSHGLGPPKDKQPEQSSVRIRVRNSYAKETLGGTSAVADPVPKACHRSGLQASKSGPENRVDQGSRLSTMRARLSPRPFCTYGPPERAPANCRKGYLGYPKPGKFGRVFAL